MKPTQISPLSWLAAIPLLFSGVAWASVSIPITNAGFEAPALNENVFTQSPASWSAYNGADIKAYNPTTEDFSAEAPEGLNVGAVNWATPSSGEQGLEQSLNTTFQENDSYTLTVKVGYSLIRNPFSTPGYRVQLLAGTTVIAEDNNTLSLTNGQFSTSTVSYTDTADDLSGLVGQQLRIRLINKALTINENQVAFDDVRLTAVLANPYANAGGPYYLSNPAVSLYLNASNSLPSGATETINAYAWDLDNDGQFDDATGATPSPISYSDLQNVYGMVDGSNTVRLSITDTSGKSAIATVTVGLVTSTKYTAVTANNDDWNSASSWDNGVPQGDLDAMILAGKIARVWSNATPTYKGNLTLQTTAQLVIGWTTSLPGSYNALGTPGLTKIIMNSGSSILTRMGGTPVIPEIQLLGNATLILGTSTQPGAQAQFNYPITGAYQLQLQGNNLSGCVANLNTANGFSSLLASGSESGLTIKANAAGSLGTGNVTIAQRTGNTTNYAILEINAANAMADTATLSLSGQTTVKVKMTANDTIAGLIINGVQQAAGIYGKTGSGAQFPVSWIDPTSTGFLTVAAPAVSYWDINSTTAGAGGTSPNGTWDASNTFWNTSSAGTGSVAAWTAGRTAIFSAGSDATGAYAVTVAGTQNISGLIIQSGSLALSGGALNLTSNSNISVDAGSSTIATPINDSAFALSKSGAGSLTFSGNLSQNGGTTLLSGNLTLSGDNSGATGATTIGSGVLRVDTPLSIPGAGQNITINSTGTLVFGPSFDSTTIQAALSRIVTSSAGTIAADNNSSDNFNFSSAGLTAAYFGAMSDVNFTGTLTPQGTVYRLRSDGGTLTMANALTGARNLTTRGDVVLAVNNSYSGTTTVETNGSLSLLGSNTTSGITLNAGSTLTVGNDGSLGNGTLTLSGMSTLKAVGSVFSSRPIAANSDFNIAGSGTLTLGTTTINANRTITNIASGTTTFTSIVNGAVNLSLTIDGSGNTTVSGSLTLPNGNLTKNGSGTLTLNGANTYLITNINGGILRLNGSTSGAGTTTIFAAGLQLGSSSNGGLPTGNITISNPAAFIQAVSADRSISNSIIIDNNITFSGSNNLTINGKLTNNNANRILTNDITSTKALTLGNVDLSQNTTNRTLTVTGSGKTVVNGIIQNGGGSTAGALIKSGTGQLILNGANTYAGTTTVNANSGELVINGSMGSGNITINGGSNLFINGSSGGGSITMNGNSKLYVNGTTGSGNITINNGATLLGTGTIGGDTTIADGGMLEFEINNADPLAHNPLKLAAGKKLTFSGDAVFTITGTPSSDIFDGVRYTLMTAPGGIVGTPYLLWPNLNISDWDAELSIEGTNLILTVYYTGDLPNLPTLQNIADNMGGGPVDIYTPITYTVTFSEDMNDSTVSAADFSNGAVSPANIIIDDITETAPGVFTIQVTPTTAGGLRLKINAGATLRSAAGLNLVTTSALLDNNTLNIVVPTNGVLAVTSGDFTTVGDPGGPFSPVSKTYTLTNYGNQSLNWTASKTAAWLDLSSTSGTLAANGGNTTVTVTPNANANALAIGSYFDTITFTNTSFGLGNTTRGASLTVNGLPVVVTLGNLNQTYDGTPKAVSVTTNPVKTYSLTYNGLTGAESLPTDAGYYDIVATVTEPGYTGSASGTLIIAKASQTINFAALNPIGNDQSSTTLTATSTSNLPVTFTSSNTSVATVVGNTMTIVGVGTTTITADQAGDENYHPATSVARSLTVTRTNPLAVPGGPYTVSSTQNLTLNGSGSLASEGQTIATYQWDLDDGNDGGGAFTADVTTATPSAITMAVLKSTYGMVVGSNSIRLRVTDTAGKISTVSTTVIVTGPLRWDSNATYADGQNDGSGGWLSGTRWRDDSIGANVDWQYHVGEDVIFGNGGAGGSILLPATTSVGSITFNNFTGTYDIGDALTLTINRGITQNTAGTANFSCPIILGADQTWTNTAGTLNIPAQLDLGATTLTIDNTATINLTGQSTNVTIGTGGIIKNGTGTLFFGTGPDSHQYTGPTVLNAGRIRLGNGGALPAGNMTLSGGILQAYWGFGVTRALGSGAGQIQLTGGTTGFSSISSNGASVTLNNSASYEVVWGSQYFSPSVLLLETGAKTDDMSFNNKLDLNGATRTVSTPIGPGGTTTATATLSGIIRNSSATMAGLIKTGDGILRLNAANTYNGGTTIQQGTLQLGNVNGLGSSVGTLTINGGLLNLNNIAAVTVGNLTGTGGTIANNGAGALTFTIGNGGGTGGNFQGVIANTNNASTGTVALTKTGSGSINLSGANTYTGATSINQGKLFINGSTAASNITVANGATLGGNGTLGGNAIIASGGKLEFNLSTPAGSHNPLDFATGKGLTFSGASELTINVSGNAAPGTYVLVTGGNNITGIAPATLNLPSGCFATVSIVNNELRLVVTAIGDITPPTLPSINIVDNKSGGPIAVNTLVTYTVTFSEDMDLTTVSAADFGNAGTSSVTIGTVTEPSPGVFSVPVTPITTGTLQLRVNAGADLRDVAGNALDTTSAIADNTTITVQPAFTNWSGGAASNTDANNDGISNGMAWLLGAANSNTNATNLLPTFDNTSDSAYFIYTYRRSDAANTSPSTIIAVEYGSTLGNWTTATHDGSNIIITQTGSFSGANPGAIIQVKIKRTLATSSKLFTRLKLIP